jgi:hypothetical protein
MLKALSLKLYGAPKEKETKTEFHSHETNFAKEERNAPWHERAK